MKLLIIGGTRFLGRALAEEALARGYDLTLFHRGQSNPDLFPEATHLIGDRDGGLAPLDGRTWDVVIDTCGYFPRIVAASAAKLASLVERYIFISSISVYGDVSQPGVNENDLVGTIEDETIEEITGESYGPLKALCEQAVEAALPGRTLVIRPGLIVGPHDVSDRFTYWPVRMARGGDVLAPGKPEAPVQMIDVRDLAVWTLDMAEKRATGIYNTDSPGGGMTMSEVLETCRVAAGSSAVFHWVPDQFLLEQEVAPWMELPLWIPESPEDAGFMLVDSSKAMAAGLSLRPLLETARDTLAWHRTRSGETMKNALTAEKEAAVLRAWQNRAAGNGE